jgi:hypothetical protein
MKPAKFEDNNGTATYSIPEARNLSMMNSIVTREPTESNLSSIPNIVTPPSLRNFETKPYINSDNKNTLSLNEDVEANRMEDPVNVNEIIRKSKSGTSATMKKVSPPNLEEDILNSQLPNTSSMEFKAKKSVGGSLYKSLIDNSANRVMPGGSRKAGGRKGGRKTRRN